MRHIRRPGSTTLVVALIATMMTLVIAGFLFVAKQQADLADVRDRTRAMRMTRQTLMQLDTLVLTALARDDKRPDLVAYGKASNKLDSMGITPLPRIVMRGSEAVPSTAVLATLRLAWDDMMRRLSAGEPAEALRIYEARQVERDMNAFVTAYQATLDAIDLESADIQKSIDRTITTCLAGQILTALVSILAFLLAALKGARESEARARAVTNADAAREQVVRLFHMTDMLQSASELEDASAVLTATAAELLPGFSGALYAFNNSRDRLVLSTCFGPALSHDAQETIGLNQCWALKRGKPHISMPGDKGLRCEHHHGDHALLEIPMIARGEILGLLQITASGPDAAERLATVTSVGTAMADAMSLALANLALRDKLRSQALRDPLTGLYNRRYMEDTLDRLVRLAEREKSDLSVLMLDLDHFKRLNDQHGHAKGDAVLRDVAALITANLRDSDVACRYGGEELLVILPQCSAAMAAKKAERLRSAIETLSTENGPQVSASIGVASIPEAAASVPELLAVADAALYEAKRAGRNRVANAPRHALTEDGEAAFSKALDAA